MMTSVYAFLRHCNYSSRCRYKYRPRLLCRPECRHHEDCDHADQHMDTEYTRRGPDQDGRWYRVPNDQTQFRSAAT